LARYKATANGSSSPESFSESRMAQSIRVVIGVLSHSIASAPRISPSESASFSVVLDVAWLTLLDIADQHDAQYREDLYAVAITLYARLLQCELREGQIIQSALPSLKRICERSGRLTNSHLVPQVLQALFTSCLQNVDDVQEREEKSAAIKASNNLLAASLILTALPPTTRISQSDVDHYCDTLTDTMASPNKELALTALQCSKSIINSATRGDPILQYSAGQLLVGLINFGATVPSTFSQGGQELVKTLEAFMTLLPDAHKRDGLSVVLPILIIFLKPSEPSVASHATTMPVILTMATQYSAAFKEASQTLDGSQRTLLESSVRQSVGSSGTRSTTSAQTSIDLRMSF